MRRIMLWGGFLAALLVGPVGLSEEPTFPVTVIDDRSQAVTIEALPERIIAVGALYAEIVVDLGALDRLIAVAESLDNPVATAELPTVGPTYAPNVELIIGLDPDLVLGATDWGGERPALETAGVAVLTTPLLASVADIFASIRSVGEAIGKEEESAILIGRIAEEVVRSETTVLGLPKVQATFLYASSPDAPPYAGGEGTIEHELILRAGGENVFSDVKGFPQVGFEEILARDPKVIFTAPSQIENIATHPLLQGVSAIRNGRTVGIRASQVASTQVAEALRAIIRALHDVEI
jgi:iron complex transport system substrate-binding protein